MSTEGTGGTESAGGAGRADQPERQSPAPAGRQGEGPRSIEVKLYQGVPTVELTEDDKMSVRLDLSESLAKKLIERASHGPIQISLQSLNVELMRNQSFGMVDASTGCISNPGGPSC